jgi:enoyl-CoA hydratase/carnithine racemase
MSETQKVMLEIEDSIATVTLNRPEVLNAMNAEIWQGLVDVANKIKREPEVRVVIITGAGDRAFSSGLDLKAAAEGKAFPDIPIRQGPDVLTTLKYSFTVYEELSVPVIAAIQGYCLGAGLQLAVACDFRIASEDAQLAILEVSRLGIVPDVGGTQRLPRLVGPSRAKLILMTGRRIDAQEALRIGLVDEVHPKDKFMEAARSLAREIAALNPAAVQGVKRSVNVAMSHSLEVGLAFETATALSVPAVAERVVDAAKSFSDKRSM